MYSTQNIIEYQVFFLVLYQVWIYSITTTLEMFQISVALLPLGICISIRILLLSVPQSKLS